MRSQHLVVVLRTVLAAGLVLLASPASAQFREGCSDRLAQAEEGSGSDVACPTAVPGTTVTVEDTADGVALVFVNGTGAVDDVQAQVRELAELHNQHHVLSLPPHRHVLPHRPGLGTPTARHDAMDQVAVGPPIVAQGSDDQQISAEATVEDTELGARLLLVPLDSSQLEALRARLRSHAEQMLAGHCPSATPEAPSATEE